jgi:hypothetical protein
MYPEIPPPPGEYTTWTSLATSANVIPEYRHSNKKEAILAAVRYFSENKKALLSKYGAKYIVLCETELYRKHPLVTAWLENAALEMRLEVATAQIKQQQKTLPDRSGTYRCCRCLLPIETTNEKGKRVVLANAVTCALCPGKRWLCITCIAGSDWASVGSSMVCPGCRLAAV